MKKIIALTWLLMILNCSFSQGQVDDPAKKMDQLLKEWENKDKPGMAVAIIQNNQVMYKKAVGMANLAYGIPIDYTTRFHVGSISKQFAAFAILLLEEKNKLSLSDDIRKHLPALPQYRHQVTIRHLLNHTSGIRDNGDLLRLVGAKEADEVTFGEMLRLVQQQKELNFVPGSAYEYCNAGYMLLAKIVENISQKSFTDFVSKNILKPLHMSHTTVFDAPRKIVKKLAPSYYSTNNKKFRKSNLNFAVYGATGIITSLDDLCKWAMNFYQPKVGSSALFKKMKERGILNNGDTLRYALGQEIKTYKGLECVYHGGGIASYRAYLMRFPAQKFAIVILSNAQNSGLFILKNVKQMADWYLKKDLIEPRKVKSEKKTVANKELLQAYVGSYQIQPGLIFMVKRVKNTLQVKITDENRFIPLKAVSAREFTWAGSIRKIVFPVKKKGQPIPQLHYWQGDFEYIGKRVKTVAFDPQKVDLKQVLGRYYSPELRTSYTMIQKGGKLTALHARNSSVTFQPFQPDDFIGNRFFFQRIVFVRNKQMQVIGCKISGARAKNIYFERVEQ